MLIPTLSLHNQLDRFLQPVRPVAIAGSTPPVRPVTLTGQTSPRQNRGVAHTALKDATRQLPSLGVSHHHFPPLCISADELDTSGAEVNIRMACNDCGNKP